MKTQLIWLVLTASWSSFACKRLPQLDEDSEFLQAVGQTNKGRLLYPRKLPLLESIKDPWVVFPKRSDHYYGTVEFILPLQLAFYQLNRQFPDKEPVIVGDIALKKGGKLLNHRSHQNGLDIDIKYPHIRGMARPELTSPSDGYLVRYRFRPKGGSADPIYIRSSNIDIPRTAALIVQIDNFSRLFCESELQFAFVTENIGLPLKNQLTKMGRSDLNSTIRYAPNHDDHVHIRVTGASDLKGMACLNNLIGQEIVKNEGDGDITQLVGQFRDSAFREKIKGILATTADYSPTPFERGRYADSPSEAIAEFSLVSGSQIMQPGADDPLPVDSGVSLNVTAIEVYDKKRFLVSYVPTDFDSELVGTVDINALRLPGGPISCNGRSEINNRSTWAVTQDSIIPGDPSNPTATGNYKAHPEVVSLPLGQLVTVNSYQGDDWAKVTVDGKNMMIHRAYILPALNVCHAAGVTKPSSQNNQNNSSRCGQFTNVGC